MIGQTNKQTTHTNRDYNLIYIDVKEKVNCLVRRVYDSDSLSVLHCFLSNFTEKP